MATNYKLVYGGVALAFFILSIVLAISWATRKDVSKTWIVAAVVSLVIGIISFVLFMTTSDDENDEEPQSKEKSTAKKKTCDKRRPLPPRTEKPILDEQVPETPPKPSESKAYHRKKITPTRTRRKLPPQSSLDTMELRVEEEHGIESFAGDVRDEIALDDLSGYETSGLGPGLSHGQPVDTREYEIRQNAPAESIDSVVMSEKDKMKQLMAGRENTTRLMRENFERKHPGKKITNN